MKNMKFIIFLAFIAFLFMAAFGGYSIWRELRLSDPNYVDSELQRIEEEATAEKEYVELLNTNPDLIDVTKLTPEQKTEVTLAKIAEGKESGVYVNDYMKEITDDIIDEKTRLINGYIIACDWKNVAEEAKKVKETYDLTDEPEFFSYVNNLSILEYIVNNALDDVSYYLSGFTEPEYAALGFALSNTDSQANAIVIKESEVLPASNDINIIETISYGLEKMNAVGMYNPAKNYSGYRVKLGINGNEYFVYIVYDKTTQIYTIFKTMKVGDMNYQSDNNYANLI